MIAETKPEPPLLPSHKELNSRWARWKRRYPSLGAWLAAHPGEAVGIMHGQPELQYYWGLYNGTRVYHWTVIRVSDLFNELSKAEYREARKLPPATPMQGPAPTWPPTPEQWGKRRNGKPKPVNGRPGDALLRRYADYGKLVRGVGMTPRSFEDWVAKLKT